MSTFNDFDINKQLRMAIDELAFTQPTAIQEKAFPVVRSGRDIVGIAPTGTGKTLAYMLPILADLKFSKQVNPRILIMVPTRELVLQLVENIEAYTQYMSIRTLGIFGGVNINNQMMEVAQGCDILVATPGRLYDLVINRAVQFVSIKKLVVDEVDVMLDLGFRFQLQNIFDLLPEKRQNIMFSATMTEEVEELINDFFVMPENVSVAISGEPLKSIEQCSYNVPNFKTKVNLLTDLLIDKQTYSKVLVFTSNKKQADRLFESLEMIYGSQMCIIHGNKSQNYRIRSVQEFDSGEKRILIATDVMARGIDFDKITHVINFDVPAYPENYIHRIGRTGRADHEGKSVLFFTDKEKEAKQEIEALMQFEVPVLELPEDLDISNELVPEERTRVKQSKNRKEVIEERGASFHEKKEKNKKTNLGGSYKRKLAEKYKKPKSRGDKNINRKKKRR
ncbi:DEAD/DEAH box helicase [Prolixibacteraceae bacterium JC049]|nr:DEAD/DEAH box helicase [Prolixibacteraceae bacterium JC049]